MTRRKKIIITCGIVALSAAYGFTIASHANGGRFDINFLPTLPVIAAEFALFLAVPLWCLWAIGTNQRISINRKIFGAVTTTSLILSVILSLHGSGSWDSYPATVAVIGLLLNGFFAAFLRPWMTTPVIKVFSDKTHEKITTAVIAANGMFFIIFPFSVNYWQEYMLQTFPNFVRFLHWIFG